MVFVVKNVSSYLPDKKYKFSPPLTPLLCNVLKDGKAQTVGLSKATIIMTVLFIAGRPPKPNFQKNKYFSITLFIT